MQNNQQVRSISRRKVNIWNHIKKYDSYLIFTTLKIWQRSDRPSNQHQEYICQIGEFVIDEILKVTTIEELEQYMIII